MTPEGTAPNAGLIAAPEDMGLSMAEEVPSTPELETGDGELETQALENADTDETVLDDESADSDELDESGNEDGEEQETGGEAWLQENDTALPESVPIAQHAHMRSKLKGKLNARDSEIETLRAEVEALKNPANTQAPSGEFPKELPKREDYYSHEDPDGAYIEALTDYKLANAATDYEQRYQQQQADQQKRETQKRIDQQVAAHYDRAAALITKAQITPETYQQADTLVRQTLDTVLTGQGDAIADTIIARMGEGSEKVMYYVGRNPQVREKLRQTLVDDPTGLETAVYLGSLKGSLTNPKVRKSSAPKPASRITGDEPATQGNPQAKKLRAAYNSAHKKGDPQAAFDARYAARKAGIDVSTW